VINFLIILIILFFLGIYLQKKNFLVDNTGFSKHKSFVKSSKKIPVTGGLFLLLTFIFFNLINLDFIYSCLLLLIFSIGFFSDLSNNFSPKIRFIIQIFITLILSFLGNDFLTSLSGAATSLANVGPGLGNVIGPSKTFVQLSDSTKWVLISGMLIGRLELLAVIIILTPSFWKD